MTNWLGDLRYAARTLLRTPGFTAVAVLSLALGIAANVAAFSFVNAMLLRPLPVADAGRLVALLARQEGAPPSTVSYPDYRDYKALTDVFVDVAAHTGSPVTVGGGERPQMAWSEVVTANYFDVVGARLALGRGFRPEENQPGGPRVVVLSHGLWERRFAGDPAVVGKAIRVNGKPHTVVGVAGTGFTGTRLFAFAPELFVPMASQVDVKGIDPELLERRDYRAFFLVGRLREGVDLKQAQAAAAARARTLEAEHPDTNRGLGVQLYANRSPINPWVLPPEMLRRIAALAMLAMVLVLAIACANVANLLLARATARRKEIAIRLSIGSSRARLVRQLLTESVVLGLLGGGVGLLLAAWLLDVSATLRPTLDFTTAFDPRIDVRVLAFTAGVSLLTGVVFGLVPALGASRSSLVPALKDEEAGRAGARSRLRDALVVAQLALSLLLLVGAGLFVRGFQRAREIDPGFNPESGLVAGIDLDLQGYDETRRIEFQRRLLEAAERIPGVRAATLAYPLPLDAYTNAAPAQAEGVALGPDEHPPEVFFSVVGPDYFSTLETPIVVGRVFDERDREGATRVVIVNQALVRRLWPGEDAVGKRLMLPGLEGLTAHQVVGVARDGKYLTLGEAARPYMFLPLAQNSSGRMTLVLRTISDPEALVSALRAAVRTLDPELPLIGVKTLRQQMELPLSGAQSGATTVGFFGVLALLLAASGIYGVISYVVARRTREIGIRVALGARRGDVLRLVVGRGAQLAAVGIALGLGGALLLSRALSGFLYGVSPLDPLTYATVTLVLGGVALLASYVPARRAARVDPVSALRTE